MVSLCYRSRMTLPALPKQPSQVPWPAQDWPTGQLRDVDRAAFNDLVGEAFAAKVTPNLGETHALLVVQGGQVTFERYGDGFDAASTHHSWSMAKSITQALVGFLVKDGKLDISAPADVPAWRGDARAAITLDHLLRMSSGLKFIEDYAPGGGPSDVIAMLFGEGKDDVAAYAAAQPLEHAPGTFWSYASGTTNIVSRIASRALGAYGADFERFMRERLFEPLGIRSAIPKFDDAGTFIGSSFCFMTARDFARFGLLYLRDGAWDGQRLLPEGWVDYARRPTFQQAGVDANRYGAHWWLDFGGRGSFSANGYDGQFIIIVPERDLIIVRHGVTPLALKENLKAWLGKLAASFA
ncbi:MAG: serine hydrolase [Alphaproteobacteria bacterium]|nr:serine hydrolase [Alphaproteobacteria bacterium]